MPYIHTADRARFDPEIDAIIGRLLEMRDDGRKGALNYIISRIVAGGIHPGGPANWKYNEIADVIGTFECAKLEFYRRIADPKEDNAIATNGDIPEYGW